MSVILYAVLDLYVYVYDCAWVCMISGWGGTWMRGVSKVAGAGCEWMGANARVVDSSNKKITRGDTRTGIHKKKPRQSVSQSIVVISF